MITEKKNFIPTHKPVLQYEVLSFLRNCDKLIADLTIGLGGHSKLFLKKNNHCTIYGVDRDKEAIIKSKERLQEDHFFFHNDFFSQVTIWKKESKEFDFIFADLGVSSLQLDDKERGFSFSKTGKLDMRMNQEETENAYDLINSYSQEELARVFFQYGEEARGKFFAKKIVEYREKIKIKTTTELGDFIKKLSSNKKKYHRKKIHPATKVFQAIRIEVNQELELLKKLLTIVLSILKPAGRLAIVSFHSLEDRIIKQQFKLWEKPPSKTLFPLPSVFPEPLVKVLTKKTNCF